MPRWPGFLKVKGSLTTIIDSSPAQCGQMNEGGLPVITLNYDTLVDATVGCLASGRQHDLPRQASRCNLTLA